MQQSSAVALKVFCSYCGVPFSPHSLGVFQIWNLFSQPSMLLLLTYLDFAAWKAVGEAGNVSDSVCSII